MIFAYFMRLLVSHTMQFFMSVHVQTTVDAGDIYAPDESRLF